MKLEKGIISSSQIMLSIAGFIQGSVMTIAFTDKITKHDTWLVVIAGFVLSIPFILVYTALAQRFPRQNLVQINDTIYGPYLGSLISALYICFFLSAISANLRIVGGFLTTYIIPETPMIAILIMFTFVCSWAVRSGIEVIARTSFIFVVITIIIDMLTFSLLLKDMKFTNFMPIYELPLMDFIHGINIIVAIPFGGIMIFLMIIPYMNKLEQTKSSVFLGIIIGGMTLLTIMVQNTAVLGITSTILVSPSFEAVRLINIADIITRLEILVAIVLLVTMFLRVSLFYYVTVVGMAQLFHLRSYRPLVLPIGIISISFSMLMFDSTIETGYIGANIWPIYTIPFEFLLPLISLLLAKIRRLPKQPREASR